LVKNLIDRLARHASAFLESIYGRACDFSAAATVAAATATAAAVLWVAAKQAKAFMRFRHHLRNPNLLKI